MARNLQLQGSTRSARCFPLCPSHDGKKCLRHWSRFRLQIVSSYFLLFSPLYEGKDREVMTYPFLVQQQQLNTLLLKNTTFSDDSTGAYTLSQ